MGLIAYGLGLCRLSLNLLLWRWRQRGSTKIIILIIVIYYANNKESSRRLYKTLDHIDKKSDIISMDQQNLDFKYFLDNMGEFYRKYGHKFVVVKNQSILAVYDDFMNAYESTLKTEEIGTFLIQECFDNVEKMVNHFQGNVMPIPA